MQRPFAHVLVEGVPTSWLGANFWSRVGGPRMWSHYDGETVSQELQVLADHGLTMTRSFLYWPDLHPEPGVVDQEMLGNFVDFLDRHGALGLRTVPTFIVGHMSGQNWDPVWRGDRDLYADVWLVGRQAWFAGQVVRRCATHPAVAGWLLSNEMPIYGRPPHEQRPVAPREQVAAWVQLLVDAVRAAGGTQPVSTGDGTWGPEMTGVDNGFSVRDIAPMVDFLGPHVYRMETDIVRQHLAAAFVCDLAGFAGRPVVLEEFGVSTAFVSDENAAHYYRQVLHNSLLAGATGWIAWNNTDYDDLADQPPYSHHPFEMYFGITDRTGVAKTPLLELQRFRALLERIDVTHCHRRDSTATLVVPAYVETAFPFTTPADRTAPLRSLQQAYVAARESDLPVAFSREVDGIADDARLVIAPSIKALTAPTWRRLRELAEAGATVYVSYFAGDHDGQRGPWYADLNELFGVRHQLVYGLADHIEDDVVTLHFERPFGLIPAGTELRFAVAGGPDARSYLPVSAVGAEVIAVDGHGRPALLMHELGAGRTVFATYPFEYLAAGQRAVNPEPTYLLYDALATIAGVPRDVRVDDPLVHVGELEHHDGTRFVWLVSQSAEGLVVKPEPVAGLRLLALDGDDTAVDTVALPPYGVEVFRLGAAR